MSAVVHFRQYWVRSAAGHAVDLTGRLATRADKIVIATT